MVLQDQLKADKALESRT